MAVRKHRIEIPAEIAAQLLFASDRTCCVCRVPRRPIQIHHIDDNPSNCSTENLAVLCFDCHRDTQVRGGFDRKLDASQIVIYRSDWLERVAAKRDWEHKPELTSAKRIQILRFLQRKETSDQYLYELEADYPQIESTNSATDSEINVCISAFVTRAFQEFRVGAIGSAAEKNKVKRETSSNMTWDSLSISHDVSIFTSDLLSIRFSLCTYYSMAVHPNTHTVTLNFRLRPPKELKLGDIFRPSSDYLNLLSEFCVKDLHRQQPLHWFDPEERAEWLKQRQDEWILSGAAPKFKNLERFVLAKGGMRLFFDPYQVGSYAEGMYDVFIPTYVLAPALEEWIAPLLA